MKFASTLAALFFFLASSAMAQIAITLPIQGSSYPQRGAVPLLITGSGSVTNGVATTVVFTNGVSSFTGTYNVGTQYSVSLPWNFVGYVSLSASATIAGPVTFTASSNFNVYAVPCYNPCFNPCYNPYYNRCHRPREEPERCRIPKQPVCRIPRYRCGRYNAEGVQEIYEFDAVEGAQVPADAVLVEAEYVHGEQEQQQQQQQEQAEEQQQQEISA